MILCSQNGSSQNLHAGPQHPLIKNEQQVTSSSNGLSNGSLKVNSTTVDSYTELCPITNSLTSNHHNDHNLTSSNHNTNDLYELIMNIEQAHHAHCEYVDELSLALTKKGSISGGSDYNSSTSTNGSPICGNGASFSSSIGSCMSPYTHSSASSSSSISNSTVSSSAELSPGGQIASPDSPEHRLMLWQRLANLITPSIHRVVEFSKRVPCFVNLSQDDQLILIKLGFFECWLVHMSKWYNALEGTLTFSCGSIVNAQQLQIIFDVSLPEFAIKLSFELPMITLIIMMITNDPNDKLFFAIIK